MDKPQGPILLSLLVVDLGNALLRLGAAQVAVTQWLQDHVAEPEMHAEELIGLQASVDQLETVLREGNLRIQGIAGRLGLSADSAADSVGGAHKVGYGK